MNHKSHGQNSGSLTEVSEISRFCATLPAIGCTWTYIVVIYSKVYKLWSARLRVKEQCIMTKDHYPHTQTHMRVHTYTYTHTHIHMHNTHTAGSAEEPHPSIWLGKWHKSCQVPRTLAPSSRTKSLNPRNLSSALAPSQHLAWRMTHIISRSVHELHNQIYKLYHQVHQLCHHMRKLRVCPLV